MSKETEAKKRAFKHLCQTQPHKAYLADREGFVREFQESRDKQFDGREKGLSKREIEKILDSTR